MIKDITTQTCTTLVVQVRIVLANDRSRKDF